MKCILFVLIVSTGILTMQQFKQVKEKKKKRKSLTIFIPLTFAAFLGLSCANFFAAISIEDAAVSSSFSAMTVGSSGSIQSVPDEKMESRFKCI